MSEEFALPIEWPKWPKVPACYGWLSLDRRGNWRLKGDLVRHRGLADYLNSHYAADAQGNWLVSNGPQAVYVALDYVPLVWRLMETGLFAHAGHIRGMPRSLYIDESGSILFACPEGIGLLHDQDLADFAGELCDNQGQVATDEELASASLGCAVLNWRGMPLIPIRSEDVPGRFGFNPDPKP